MARSLEYRISRLEAPRGDPAPLYRMLKTCYEILSRLDHEPMPSDAELWAMAEAEAASGHTPDYTAALEAVWRDQLEP